MKTILKVSERDDAVIAMPGIARFDLQNTEQLRRELGQLGSDTGNRPLLLDLSTVEFLPSATIGVLVELANRCREARRPLALIRVQPDVIELLELCALDKLFTIQKDEEAALAAL